MSVSQVISVDPRSMAGQRAGGLSVLPKPGKLSKHFMSLGVPRDLSRTLALRFYTWYAQEGAEHFVKRLKALLNELLTGNLCPWQSRVRLPDGRVVSKVLAELIVLPFKVRVRVLRCYTFVRLKRVTVTQERKFFGSMVLPAVQGPTPDSIWWDFGPISELKMTVKAPRVPDLKSWVRVAGRPKGYPVLAFDEDGVSLISRGAARKRGLPVGTFSVRELSAYIDYWNAKGILPAYVLQKWRAWVHPNATGEDLPSGMVSGIQERGAKLRAVANPHPALHWGLEPLGDVLFGALRSLERDCTHDQSKALPVVRDWLRQGLTVHSVDLSDATNAFPLNWQTAMLRSILPKSWEWQIALFEHASQGDWTVGRGFPNHQEGSKVRWTKGQPLGLQPSFASFALAHHALLGYLSELYGGDYRVLGDDVVILGDRLKRAYLKWLTRIGVSYSPDKTISSNRVAEFAGMIIDRKGWVNKWNDGDLTATASFGKMVTYGASMSNYVLRLAQLGECSEPVKAAYVCYQILPTEWGGAGKGGEWAWHRVLQPSVDVSPVRTEYPGLPGYAQLALRDDYLKALPPIMGGVSKKVLDDLAGLNGRVGRLTYEARPSAKGDALRFFKKCLAEFDQRPNKGSVLPGEGLIPPLGGLTVPVGELKRTRYLRLRRLRSLDRSSTSG